MSLFQSPILTKKRKKELDSFRKNALKALEELSRREKNVVIRNLYENMALNISRTPLFFYDAKNLESKVFKVGGMIFGSVKKGEHVRKIMVYQQGPFKFVKSEDYINLPADHIFEGDKLNVNGIFTLAHEYAHFPKREIGEFASAYGLTEEQAEELIADILSAKLAVKMGYPKGHVLSHFAGREIVYGSFPFEKFIRDAVK